jgi:hypothetical protein
MLAGRPTAIGNTNATGYRIQETAAKAKSLFDRQMSFANSKKKMCHDVELCDFE